MVLLKDSFDLMIWTIRLNISVIADTNDRAIYRVYIREGIMELTCFRLCTNIIARSRGWE